MFVFRLIHNMKLGWKHHALAVPGILLVPTPRSRFAFGKAKACKEQGSLASGGSTQFSLSVAPESDGEASSLPGRPITGECRKPSSGKGAV